MSDDFEHMDIPESVRKAVREVEDYFNSRTLGTWEYMGLADRRLVCQLREELNASKERIKKMQEIGDEMWRWIVVKRNINDMQCTDDWFDLKD